MLVILPSKVMRAYVILGIVQKRLVVAELTLKLRDTIKSQRDSSGNALFIGSVRARRL